MRMRSLAAAAALFVLGGLAACGNEQGESHDPSHSSEATTSVDEQLEGPEPGSTELPEAVDVNSLPTADAADGLMLVQRDANGGCTVLTYADGQLKTLGTFPALQAEHKPDTQHCNDPVYTSDYTTRVNEIYANWQDEYTFNTHVVAQPIGMPEQDITPDAENASGAVIGPDDRIYFTDGGGFVGGEPSVMNLDGSGLEEVENGESDPAWVGGKLVDAEFAYNAESNQDGSLAVEYVDSLAYGDGPGYRIGAIQEGQSSGPTISNDGLVANYEALRPLAWVGDNQFLTHDAGTIYINTVVEVPDGLDVTREVLAEVPEEALGAEYSLDDMVVCGDEAYFTVSTGGTQVLPDHQSAVVGVNVSDGVLTVWISVLNHHEDGSYNSTQLLGCAS